VLNLPNPNDVSPTTSQDLRCPQCSAQTSPGADWCTLCFADLRPPPPVVAAPEPPPAVEPPAVEPPTVELDSGHEGTVELPGVSAGPGNGKHARAAKTYDESLSPSGGVPHDAATVAEIEARADEMLAMLVAERTNPLGPVAERLATTHSRIAAGLIGLVIVSLCGWLVMTVLGHFV
jgi:hypothetical protein